MRRSSWPFLITALVLASGVGCQTKPPVQQKVPSDPLLSSKKPIEGRPPSADSGREAATLYPVPPTAPIDDSDQLIRRVSVLPERIDGDASPPSVRLGEPQFRAP
jgi:hypothetical protein